MKTSSERKRELREQYKLMRPDMGIFAVICRPNSRYYLETTENLRGAMNSTEFKLNAGMHPKKALQKDWSEFDSKSAFSSKSNLMTWTNPGPATKMIWLC